MGQANVRYLYDNHGKLSAPEWMKRAISYVESYKGENLLTDPLAEMTAAAESELEIAAGYESNPQIRKAVEDRAMEVAEGFYSNSGYAVANKSQTESYDLLCEKNGVQLFVEVKDTRKGGEVISLTANEVGLPAIQGVRVDLCVVHSIAVSDEKKPRGSGGTLVRYKDWNPQDHELRPVQYVCRLLRRLAARV
jgi:hypothetical protein